MNTDSFYMSGALKELYSDSVPTRQERFMEVLFKLDLNDKDPTLGLYSWLSHSGSAFFGLLPKGPSWQGSYISIPIEYGSRIVDRETKTISISHDPETGVRMNRKARRTQTSQERKKK